MPDIDISDPAPHIQVLTDAQLVVLFLAIQTPSPHASATFAALEYEFNDRFAQEGDAYATLF